MALKIQTRLNANNQTLAYLAYADALLECDVEIDSDPGMDPDLVLCSPEFAADAVECGTPVIILEKNDSSALMSPTLKVIDDPRIVGVLKNSVYRDRMMYVAPGRPHTRLGRLNKIHAGLSFAHYPKVRELFAGPAPKPVKRDIPISFHGTIEYGGTDGADHHDGWMISEHRAAALVAVEAIPGSASASGRPLAWPDEYRKMLNRCVAVLSPWGNGETCYRDFEALLAGCWLIKPETPWCECWPDIFDLFPGALECRPDFSDVASLLAKLWPTLPNRNVDTGREIVAESQQPAVAAAHLSRIFHACLARQP